MPSRPSLLGDSSVGPLPPRSTTTGPRLTCWYCKQQYPEGCVHHCPTGALNYPTSAPDANGNIGVRPLPNEGWWT